MPQLDPISYFSQFIYLVITFVLGYSFIINIFSPSIITIIKLRNKLETKSISFKYLDKTIHNFHKLVYVLNNKLLNCINNFNFKYYFITKMITLMNKSTIFKNKLIKKYYQIRNKPKTITKTTQSTTNSKTKIST